MANENDGTAKASAPAKQHNTGAADLEKVTDYAEEKEISAGDALEAFNAINDKRKQEADLKEQREKQLASVKVKKEDVELILNEFEITKLKAERILKENNGDLSAAMKALINA
jgi:NACalpha-BTF3-like transcription factor